MQRLLALILIGGGIFGLTHWGLNQKIPQWRGQVKAIAAQVPQAGLDPQAWQHLNWQAKKDLPEFYPFSLLHQGLQYGENFSLSFQHLQKTKWRSDLRQQKISLHDLNTLLDWANVQTSQLKSLQRQLNRLPQFLLPTEDQVAWQVANDQLNSLGQLQSQIQTLQKVLNDLHQNQDRVLLLLQNQNEPRSTGGFAGSLVLFDFGENDITWQFLDTYALDRKLNPKGLLAAPEFFQDLSTKISLRDANFWPDFPTSSRAYQTLLERAGEKPPSVVLATNLHAAERWLSLTGPIKLDPWGLSLDQHNFDLGLQFLVESKVAGRFSVKQPVEVFFQSLLAQSSPLQLELQQILSTLNHQQFLNQKNLLAYSSKPRLQKLFEQWKLTGTLQQKQDADNFLHFDFVSVGANKSEKFLWTKFHHDSKIEPDGRVVNRLKIKRTHALSAGELDDLLGLNNLPPNIVNLLTPELLWKLGQGENRIVLRLWVPKTAKLVTFRNPSGLVSQTLDPKLPDFNILEIPLFVSPGETLEAEVLYQTKVKKGSHAWRPYLLQMVGTPGRSKTSLLTTVSTEKSATILAETINLGRPVELIDQEFKAVVEF